MLGHPLPDDIISWNKWCFSLLCLHIFIRERTARHIQLTSKDLCYVYTLHIDPKNANAKLQFVYNRMQCELSSKIISQNICIQCTLHTAHRVKTFNAYRMHIFTRIHESYNCVPWPCWLCWRCDFRWYICIEKRDWLNFLPSFVHPVWIMESIVGTHISFIVSRYTYIVQLTIAIGKLYVTVHISWV